MYSPKEHLRPHRALFGAATIALPFLALLATASADLLLQYTFEDGNDPTLNTGTLGPGRNGDLRGNATFSPFGGGSQAVLLDGSNANSVVVPLGFEGAFDIGDSDLSLFARFKTTLFDDSSSSLRALIWKQNSGTNPSYVMGVRQETGQGQYRIADGLQSVVVTSTTLLNDGLPHELLGVRNGDELFLYVDGVLEDTEAIPLGFGSTNNNNALVIGGRTLGDSDDWNGLIDEVQVWNEAVPEPSTLACCLSAGLMGILRRRRKTAVN